MKIDKTFLFHFRICLVINSERYIIIMVIHGMFTISENDSLNCVIKKSLSERNNCNFSRLLSCRPQIILNERGNIK